MAYKLIKPYTAKQHADFIVLHNHQNGRKIEEGVNGELFALEPYEKLVDGEVIDNTQEYEQEQVLSRFPHAKSTHAHFCLPYLPKDFPNPQKYKPLE